MHQLERLFLYVGLFFLITPTYAQSPTVSIISPAPGEVVYGDSITANVRMPDNFILGQDGYLYFWLDAPLERDSSNAVIVPEAQHTFAQVTSGLHTLWVELVNQNYASLSPKVEAMVEFETVVEGLAGPGGGPGPVPPQTSGGFLSVSSNTVAVIILIGVAIVVLWYLFGRHKKVSPTKKT